MPIAVSCPADKCRLRPPAAALLPPLPVATSTHASDLLFQLLHKGPTSLLHYRLPQDGGRPAGGTGAGGAAGPWRSAAHRGEQAKPAGPSSRFDTSIGGRNWREEEREGAPRRDAGRWGDGEQGGGGGRQFTEPHNPAWSDAPRGRGRGAADVDSWKPRGDGDGWRAGGGDTQGGSSWRSNDRWGGGAAGVLLMSHVVRVGKQARCCQVALRLCSRQTCLDIQLASKQLASKRCCCCCSGHAHRPRRRHLARRRLALWPL